MKVVVVKDSKESNERVISRFNKAVQSSRKLVKLRDEEYHERKLSRRKARLTAVKREGHRADRLKTRFH